MVEIPVREDTNQGDGNITSTIKENSETILRQINDATGNADVKRLCKLQVGNQNATTLLRLEVPNVTRQQILNQFNTWGYEASFGAKGVYKEIKILTSDGVVKFDYQSLIN